MNCASCDQKVCHDPGRDCTGGEHEGASLYVQPGDRSVHVEAAIVEAEGYGRLCRVEEIVRYAQGLGLRRIGIAFCVGLSEEARILEAILEKRFEVTSVCCKLTSIPKPELGLRKIREDRFEAACNPIGQAQVMAQAETELNLIVGLCLGHDILFTRHSAAPVTTLVVKDRVLGHNPVAALHSSYHRRRLLAGPAPEAKESQ